MARTRTKTTKRRSSEEEPSRKRSGSSRDDVIRVDFGKEEEGGGAGVRVKEGDYLGKIISVKKGRSSEKDTPYVQVDVKILDAGKAKGKIVSDRLYITPKSLFRLRSLLEALGLTVPKKVVNIPGKKLVGKEVGITAVDDEWEGRIRSRIGDFLDPDDLDDDADDEEEDEDELDDDADEEEDDDDEEEEDEDLEDLDLDDV